MGYNIKMNQSSSVYKKQAVSANSVYVNTPSRHVTKVLKSGQWKGNRAFIIGGGPSVTEFDVSLLKGEKVIGVNRAFELYPDIDVWYGMDTSFYESLRQREFGEDKYKAWQQGKFVKVMLCPVSPYKFADNDLYFVRRLGEPQVSFDLDRGIYGDKNSGFGAMMLAVALGANPIYLIGMDMKVDGSKTHFHDGYPKQNVSHFRSKLEEYRKEFERIAPMLLKEGVVIFNLSLDSALECFPKRRVEDVLRTKIKIEKGVIDIKDLDSAFHDFKVLCNVWLSEKRRFRNELEKLIEKLDELEAKFSCLANTVVDEFNKVLEGMELLKNQKKEV